MRSLAQIKNLVAGELQAVEQHVAVEIQGKNELARALSQRLLQGGGKRLRPLLLLLTAQSFGYHGGEDNIQLAAVVELIHNATLLHDDVIDEAVVRRQQESVNQHWGNKLSILVGDLISAQCLQMVTALGQPQINDHFAAALKMLVQGEINHLLLDSSASESLYLDIAAQKTATLFTLALQMGLLLCEHSPADFRAITQFGHNFGIAYQLLDDYVDRADDAKANKVTLFNIIKHDAEMRIQALVKQHYDQASAALNDISQPNFAEVMRELAQLLLIAQS